MGLVGVIVCTGIEGFNGSYGWPMTVWVWTERDGQYISPSLQQTALTCLAEARGWIR